MGFNISSAMALMDRSDKQISLRIDISSGGIEIHAPQDGFEKAVEKAKELLDAFSASGVRGFKPSPKADVLPPADPPAQPAAKPIEKTKTRAKGGSASRPGRIGSFEPVDLGLTEEQERSLRAFMAEKSPAEQTEQVAVVMYKAEELLRRKSFAYNEIYSLLRLSGQKDLPKALDVVLGKMIDKNQWVVRDAGQFALKFVGRDHVEQGLGGAK